MQHKPKKEYPKPVLGLIILAKSMLFLPLVAAMAYINYTVDVSGVFHSGEYEQDIALSLLSGQAVDNYDQMDERAVIKQVSLNMQTPFDTLAFGSSRVLQLREEVVDGGLYYNSGVSGADFVDVTGLFYRFEKAAQLPSTMIISLEHWWLSESYYNAQERSDKNLYNEFLNVDLGYNIAYEPETPDAFPYDILLSPTYLQGNLLAYSEGGRQYTPPSIVTEDFLHQDTNLKLPDGSILYNEDFRNLPADEKNDVVLNHAVDFFWSDGFLHLDEERCAIFDEYIQYLLAQDIEVIFLIAPYHPTVYTTLLEYPERNAGFFETESYYTQYAQEHNIPLYGSYNPFVTDTPADGFFDGAHMKEEHWEDIFPGVQTALEDKEQGEAYSPWILGRVRVQEDVAEDLVRERYEIGQTERMERAEDEEIANTTAYVFGRYGMLVGVDDDVLLARYAVTQDEGIIYRFDTDAQEWVVDRRNLLG